MSVSMRITSVIEGLGEMARGVGDTAGSSGRMGAEAKAPSGIGKEVLGTADPMSSSPV